MASSIDICNSALIKLGVETITDFEDNNKRASLCNVQYDIIRKKLLRKYHWSFAIKRAALTVDSTAPLFGWDYRFALPSDYLRILQDPYYKDTPYLIEGGYLLTNEATFSIKYVYNITDASLYDSLFVETLATALAIDLCTPLAQSESLKQSLINDFKDLLSDARTINSQERQLAEEDALGADEFLDSRL